MRPMAAALPGDEADADEADAEAFFG